MNNNSYSSCIKALNVTHLQGCYEEPFPGRPQNLNPATQKIEDP